MSTTVLADISTLPTLLEAVMIGCFGIAWPIANLRMLRSGRAEGKGVLFTMIIFCGYLAGVVAKLLPMSAGHALQPVFWLYAINTASVGANLVLQWQLGRRATAATAARVVAQAA